eukprot:1405893-Ditylum_brightwellii.AAC.1
MVDDLGKDLVRDPGKFATLPKADRNKEPIEKPPKVNNVVCYDIVYGSRTTMGGYCYALFLVDRKP